LALLALLAQRRAAGIEGTNAENSGNKDASRPRGRYSAPTPFDLRHRTASYAPQARALPARRSPQNGGQPERYGHDGHTPPSPYDDSGACRITSRRCCRHGNAHRGGSKFGHTPPSRYRDSRPQISRRRENLSAGISKGMCVTHTPSSRGGIARPLRCSIPEFPGMRMCSAMPEFSALTAASFDRVLIRARKGSLQCRHPCAILCRPGAPGIGTCMTQVQPPNSLAGERIFHGRTIGMSPVPIPLEARSPALLPKGSAHRSALFSEIGKNLICPSGTLSAGTFSPIPGKT
jgi:hypothetical protein